MKKFYNRNMFQKGKKGLEVHFIPEINIPKKIYKILLVSETTPSNNNQTTKWLLKN